jgi:hypothetical protein
VLLFACALRDRTGRLVRLRSFERECIPGQTLKPPLASMLWAVIQRPCDAASIFDRVRSCSCSSPMFCESVLTCDTDRGGCLGRTTAVLPRSRIARFVFHRPATAGISIQMLLQRVLSARAKAPARLRWSVAGTGSHSYTGLDVRLATPGPARYVPVSRAFVPQFQFEALPVSPSVLVKDGVLRECNR